MNVHWDSEPQLKARLEQIDARLRSQGESVNILLN